ncbi:MAG TPA: carboxypeptidase-like regulatory domain-containing protein [Candidatus Thermoplasmatota archaeon]|nr:carboxypeptidase-like regulatory domain-containing protein [Candidatus Thermoplasmatota archaeon]
MRPALLMLAVLAVASLAGCSQKAATAAETVAPTATTGTVRGVVVDAAIRPLAGVLLTLRVGDKSTLSNTTADGLFRFEGVPAGSQVLRAHRTGYLDVQLQVQVEAGVAEPKETKVTLDIDPVYRKPFLQPFKFTGIMECSAVANAPPPAGRVAVAACALPGQTTGVSATQDSFIAVHTLDVGKPQFVQSELVWTPSGPLANTLLLYMDERNHTAGAAQVGAGGAQTGYTELASVSGTSPLVVHVEGPAVNRLGRGYDLQLRVFAWFQDPVPVGAVVEQTFTLYSTAFYGFKPPAGWEFNKDQLPTVPDS